MKVKTPFKTVRKNLMLTKSGDLYAYYKMSPRVIPMSDKEKSERHKLQLSMLFAELEKYKDIHLEMYPRDMDLDKRFEVLEKDFGGETQVIGSYYNGETKRLLENELGSVTQYEFILGVRIKNNLLHGSEDFKDVLKNAFGSVTDTLVNLLGFEKNISDEFFERFESLEQELFEQIQMANGARLTEDELIYVNRYNFLRDIHHSVEEEKKKRGITNITDCIIDPREMGYLKLKTTEGECYTSFVVVDEFPLDMEQTHLFQRAQQLPFPVEIHIKAKYQDTQDTLRKVNMVKQRFKETDNDRWEAGDDEDDQIANGKYMLNRLKNQLTNGKASFMKWVATFVVHGKTKKECKYRADEVKRYMKSADIHCVRPIADQLQLFYKFLHGQPLQFERNWVQQTTHFTFAENLFAVSNQLGSNIGFYLGRVDKFITAGVDLEQSIASSRDIVLFHPMLANKGIKGAFTDSPHIAITGQTGKGKSFLTKLLFMYLTFLNVKVLYIDPKSELKKWFDQAIENPEIRENYPLFVEHLKKFHYVTLDVSIKENWGVLDPICFLEGAEAKDVAQGIIEQIYDMHGKDDVKTALLQSLGEVVEKRARGEKVGFMNVIAQLQAYEEKSIKSAGDLLYEMTQNSVLQLVFSYGDTKALDLDEKVNILQIEGLDLPNEEDDPRYYTDSERKSLCLMLPLAKFCEKFGSKDKDEETAEIFDEAWMITRARGGKKLTKSARRVGRSYNNALIFVTQSVSDVQNEDDKGNFGVTFAFDESSEREDILKHMQMENSDVNHKMLENMMKGQCLFRDFYGRTGKIAIDCLFEEWVLAFKTVEKSNAALAEEVF
ncbi:ATP-binding protein [Bacillus paranthracis]|uniref:ATP-binding protein n=1 Tax=Bacillus paranthracis TaxID=2026186 RepID=UPI001E64F34E|nr:ATP-binding protein [Bacillus paranthracis]MCC2441836.1 ATP-binding protein [Bacillus paranthracis]